MALSICGSPGQCFSSVITPRRQEAALVVEGVEKLELGQRAPAY